MERQPTANPLIALFARQPEDLQRHRDPAVRLEQAVQLPVAMLQMSEVRRSA